MDIDAGMPAAQPRRLPVWEVATWSYDYVWEHRRRLTRPLFLVFAIAFAGNLADACANPDTGADGTKSMLAVASSYGVSLVSSLVAAALAVGIHRWVLLDEFRAGLDILRWDANFRRYVLTIIALGALSFGPLILAGSAAGSILETSSSTPLDILAGGMLFLGFTGLPVSFRFSLALPAAALGVPRPFRLSWQATRGNTWRMIGLAIALTLPFGILQVVAAVLSGTEATPIIVRLPGFVVTSVLDAAYGAVCVVSLSLSYNILVGGGDGRGHSH